MITPVRTNALLLGIMLTTVAVVDILDNGQAQIGLAAIGALGALAREIADGLAFPNPDN